MKQPANDRGGPTRLGDICAAIIAEIDARRPNLRLIEAPPEPDNDDERG